MSNSEILNLMADIHKSIDITSNSLTYRNSMSYEDFKKLKEDQKFLSKFKDGDLICVQLDDNNDYDSYVFFDGKFNILGKIEKNEDKPKPPKRINIRKSYKCTQCNAPLPINEYNKYYVKCEYCGTIFSIDNE